MTQPPSNPESETPLCDGEIDDARNVALDYNCAKDSDKLPPPLVVSVDFARTLEKKLSAALKEVERLKEVNETHIKEVHRLRMLLAHQEPGL